MVGVELGACEWFVWDLRRSNLVDRNRLEELVNLFLERHPKAEPPELADYLVQQRLVTRFQADSVLASKSQSLVLGPYTLQDTLGAGSMGTVYRALSRNSSGLFAVKVLPRRSMWNIRLARRKVKDFETFDHPAVVPFVDVGTAGGMHYLVWPFVEGQTLDAYIKELGPLPASEAASYIRQAAEGLAICQEHDLIHGLLKPSNLLLSSDRQVRILDFGVGALLAQTESESVVDTMSTANTMASGLDCASPEGIMDPTAIGPASDQYSLGCVLYFLLTGQFPFPGDNAVEKMMAHQTKQPTPVQELTATVPDGLAKVLDRLLQKQPQNRYPSMLDLVSALRPFAQESTAAAMPWKAPGSRPVQPLPAPPRQSGAMPALRMSDDRLTAHAQPPIVPPSRPAPPLSAARPAPPSLSVSERRAPAPAPVVAAPPPASSAPAAQPQSVRVPRPASPRPGSSGEGLKNLGMVVLTVLVGAAAFAVAWFMR